MLSQQLIENTKMTTFNQIPIFASTYGSGAYNTSNYNGTDAVSGTTTTTTTSGSLSNTGVAIGLIVGLAAAILLAAMVVRIWKRPSRKAIPVESDDSNQ
jgi:hypothetical protein